VIPEEEKAGWERELVEGCDELGVRLSAQQVQFFVTYGRMIRQWNRLADLVSPGDLSRLISRHFLDSLSLLRVLVPLRGARVLDVGSGGGFPGIPLKICCPGIDLTLLEPREKPWFFLRDVVTSLALGSVSLIRERAERIPGQKDDPGRFDLVLARALAPLDRLVKICLPLVRPGGVLVAYKGRRVPQEVAAAAESIRKAGGWIATVPTRVPGLSAERHLVLFHGGERRCIGCDDVSAHNR
jgi:16S rRNA (guanine527-N7)-methyltransferase